MVNIIVIGFGAMGSRTIEELNKKKIVRIEAVIDTNPAFKGKNTTDFLNGGEKIPIYDSIEKISWEGIDLAIVTIASFLVEVAPLLTELAKRRVNILTIAEELSYPDAANPELTKQLHQSALDQGITILGTGINPGFIFDMFIIVLSNACLEINEIEAKRVNNIAEFGETVLRTQGVGLTIDEFEKRVSSNEVVGHVGFPQSIHLLAKVFKWEITSLIEEKSPIIADRQVELRGKTIEKGMVIGCNHKAIAHFKNNKRIVFEHPQQVSMDGNLETKDEVKIEGIPNINLKVEPEIPGGVGTVAMIVNFIPMIMEASPGLLTILDLPRIPSIFSE